MNTTTESLAKPLTFHFQGVSHKIWFQYSNHDGQRETVCLIDRAGEDKTFAAGSAVCAKSDQFCKETGRKIALTRALRCLELVPALFPQDSVTHLWIDRTPQPAKAFRTAAWEAYRGRVRSALPVEKAASN